MIRTLARTLAKLTIVSMSIAMILLLSGCGATKSTTGRTLAGSESYADSDSTQKTAAATEKSTEKDTDKTETVASKTQAKKSGRSRTSGKSATGNDRPDPASTPTTDQQSQLSNSSLANSSSKASKELLEQYSSIESFSGGVDNSDSAAAVDDDIWRLFELSEEYHAMGVMANREASWEEAQYYFEKSLTILANLDIDEADTVMTPESVKYTTILDNVVSDYRVTLRSLGKLSTDAAPAVLVERFGSLNENFGSDSISIAKGAFTEVTYDLPVKMNDRVNKSIVYFQTVAHDAFVKYLTRSKRYNGMFKVILAEYNMPLDFVYLSLVESGYNPSAYSWARAMGLWQFISSTGRMYKLNRNWWIDERKDPIKATHAAAQFLGDLYKQFGDWELAMAAYNGGPGRVSRTIKKMKTRDFWKLKLKRQTMDYVPLIYAAAIIAKNPEKYGFYDIEFEDPVVWEDIKIDRCLDLKVVAKEVGCSLKELKRLNPELLRNYTPPNVKSYTLKIPVGTRRAFLAAYDGMPSPKETSWVKHEIRRGETISTIAARYGVSQYTIFNANNLSRRSKIYAGKKLIVPVPLDREYTRSKKNKSYQADGSIYAVRSGDTMWDIARAFGTSVSALRRINYIERTSRIYVGQKLKIPASAKNLKNKSQSRSTKTFASTGKSKTKATSKKNSAAVSGSYKVKRGDTLWDIARMYGTTTSGLRRLNGLGRSSRIYPGQVLNVSGVSAKYVIHKVRRGETLGKIARRYRTSISGILTLNGMTDPNSIGVGDRLKIQSK